MPEGLTTAAGQKLGTAAAGADTSAFDEAIAAAAADKVLPEHQPPRREKPVPTAEEATALRREAAKPKREAKPRTAPEKPKPRKSAADVRSDRVEGVKGLVQLSAVVCLAIDQRTPETDISYRADALTLVNNADAIATAVADTCDSNESLARVIDYVTQAGPYAALVGVMFSVGAQIARNHGVQAAKALGTKSPEEIIAEATEVQQAA